jgi:hypothetical protein
MTPFHYVEFYDVPRTIILLLRGNWVLLRSAFNEALDNYEGEYSVFRLPPSFQPPRAGSKWEFRESELVRVGSIPVRDVQFDPSRRRMLNAKALDEMISD